MLEYPELRHELDTLQERLECERAATLGIGGTFTVGSAQKNIYWDYFTVEIHYGSVYGFTVLPGLVLLSETCPRLACNSIHNAYFHRCTGPRPRTTSYREKTLWVVE